MIIILTHDIKNYQLSFVIFLYFTSHNDPLRTPFDRFSCLSISDVTSGIKSSDVIFIVACELSQPMGKSISLFHVNRREGVGNGGGRGG